MSCNLAMRRDQKYLKRFPLCCKQSVWLAGSSVSKRRCSSKVVIHVGHAASVFSGLVYFALLEVVLHPFLSWFWLLNASTLAISLDETPIFGME